jgi:hypothetical protein
LLNPQVGSPRDLGVRQQPYLKLARTCMTRNTLIKHKEVTTICEESGSVIANYNVLITQPKSKPIA